MDKYQEPCLKQYCGCKFKVTVLAEWEGPETLGKGSSLISPAASGPGALWLGLPMVYPHLLATFPFLIECLQVWIL